MLILAASQLRIARQLQFQLNHLEEVVSDTIDLYLSSGSSSYRGMSVSAAKKVSRSLKIPFLQTMNVKPRRPLITTYRDSRVRIALVLILLLQRLSEDQGPSMNWKWASIRGSSRLVSHSALFGQYTNSFFLQGQKVKQRELPSTLCVSHTS